MNIKYRQIN